MNQLSHTVAPSNTNFRVHLQPGQRKFSMSAPSVLLEQDDCLVQLSKLPDNSVDLVLTDLPYGTTKCAWDTVIDLEKMWRELYRVGTKECVFVFTAQQPFTTLLMSSNMKHYRQALVWEKSNGTCPFNAKKAHLKVHEDILVFCRKGARYIPQMEEGKPYICPTGVSTGGEAGGMMEMTLRGGKNLGTRYPRSVLRFAWERGWHSTQKPVPLMRYLIETFSYRGQVVLDLTMGSGTTGVAAINAGREFIGFELDEHYMEVARLRIVAALNGEKDPKPTLEYRQARQQRALAAKALRATLKRGRGFGCGRTRRTSRAKGGVRA